MSRPLSNAVESLAASIVAHTTRDDRAALDAEREALRCPLRRPYMGLMIAAVHARPDAFATAIPRTHWSERDDGVVVVSCTCGDIVALDLPATMETCGCGRNFLRGTNEVRIDFPRPTTREEAATADGPSC